MVLKLRYVHVYCLIQNSLLSVLISQFNRLYKNRILSLPYVIYSNKKIKNMGLTGVGGIQTPNLAEVGSVEKALEKVY